MATSSSNLRKLAHPLLRPRRKLDFERMGAGIMTQKALSQGPARLPPTAWADNAGRFDVPDGCFDRVAVERSPDAGLHMAPKVVPPSPRAHSDGRERVQGRRGGPRSGS